MTRFADRGLCGGRWLRGGCIALVLAAACQGDDEPDATGGSSSTAAGDEAVDPTTGAPDPEGSSGDTAADVDTGSSDGTVDTSGSTTGSAACGTPRECADAAEANAAAALEAVRDDPDALLEFLVGMPLGGDLHHHLSGSVYAETFLAWAEADGGYCIQQSNTALSTSCGDGNDVPVPTGRRDFYLEVVRAWSMFQFVPTPMESGADHFFATFSKFGAISGTQHGRMLADVRRRASLENVSYIEPMLTSNSTARSLGEDEWQLLGGGAMSAEDYPLLHAALLASPGFPAARARLVDDAENSEQIANAEQDCASDRPDAGCEVVTRYQAYISRSGSDSGIFGQMVAAYEAAIVEPRIVGLNLVGPEDGSAAMANYDRLMAMLEYLNEDYAGVSPLRLSLHAGEITAESIPGGYELDEEQHIRKALQVAGARRIGHGVDVMHEGNAQELLDELRDEDVLVEICFASNDIILELSGEEHPVHDYLAAGVPVSVATDDQGVARSSMAAEFVRGVADQGLTYLELKLMVRASLQYAFLEGDGLWTAPGVVADVCAPAEGDTPVTARPSAACTTFLAENPRAAIQRDLEARFEAFEAEF
ncbi:MAG: adenosine deaminase [Myxococcota bacterium]